MGQITIYLDKQTEKKMRKHVRSSGLSLSKWLGQLIKERTGSEWPDSVRELAGAWTDLPSPEEIRESLAEDVERVGF